MRIFGRSVLRGDSLAHVRDCKNKCSIPCSPFTCLLEYLGYPSNGELSLAKWIGKKPENAVFCHRKCGQRSFPSGCIRTAVTMSSFAVRVRQGAVAAGSSFELLAPRC